MELVTMESHDKGKGLWIGGASLSDTGFIEKG